MPLDLMEGQGLAGAFLPVPCRDDHHNRQADASLWLRGAKYYSAGAGVLRNVNRAIRPTAVTAAVTARCKRVSG